MPCCYVVSLDVSPSDRCSFASILVVLGHHQSHVFGLEIGGNLNFVENENHKRPQCAGQLQHSYT